MMWTAVCIDLERKTQRVRESSTEPDSSREKGRENPREPAMTPPHSSYPALVGFIGMAGL
jgi:hypothetical protein